MATTLDSVLRSSCLLLTTSAFLMGCQPTVLRPSDAPVQEAVSQDVTAGNPKPVEQAETETTEAVEKALNASNSDLSVAPEKADKQVSNVVSDTVPVSKNTLASPETYCYQIRSDYWNQDVIMTVDEQSQVVGRKIEENYESYEMTYKEMSGEIIDGIVYVDETSESETLSLEWPFDPKEIYFDDEYSLQATDCAAVITRFQQAEGSAASEIANAANSMRTHRIEFAPGESRTTVSDGAIRGERIENFITAAAGQEMTLAISSVEDNAAFTLIDPSGVALGVELKEETFILPHSGNYRVIVGSTRGNASYDLEVAIR